MDLFKKSLGLIQHLGQDPAVVQALGGPGALVAQNNQARAFQDYRQQLLELQQQQAAKAEEERQKKLAQELITRAVMARYSENPSTFGLPQGAQGQSNRGQQLAKFLELGIDPKMALDIINAQNPEPGKLPNKVQQFLWLQNQDKATQEAFNAQNPPDETASITDYKFYSGLPEKERQVWASAQRGDQAPSSTIQKAILDNMSSAQKAVEFDTKLESAVGMINSVPTDQWNSGVKGSLTEWAKQQFGAQDVQSLAKTMYNDIRISGAIQNLPPGVASDKDIELVLSGTLPANANQEVLLRYMRGLQKLNSIRMQYHNFVSDYISANGLMGAQGLPQAWRKQLENFKPQEDNIYNDADAAVERLNGR